MPHPATSLDPVAVPDGLALAPLCGSHERQFGPGSGAPDAMALVAALAVDRAGAGRIDMSGLTVSAADRLLARLYTAIYGDGAECRTVCRACAEPSEFALSLAAIITEQDRQRAPLGEGGVWSLPGGTRLRPPTLADVRAAAGDAAALAAALTGVTDADVTAVEAWLDVSAPVMAFDLAAACPHCGHSNVIRFDLAAFLAARLAGEAPFLLREVHLLASRYGWSHGEILALPRTERRAFAAMIESERSAGLRSLRRPA